MATKVTYQMNDQTEQDFTAKAVTCDNDVLASAFASYINTPLAVYHSGNGTSVFAHQVQIVPA